MAAGQYDFTIEQGSTWSIKLAVQNPAGTAVNLTGWLPRCQIRKKHSSADIIASPTCTIAAASGFVYLLLTAAQTTVIPAGEYVYDVELYDSGTQVARLQEGTVTVTPEVTR